ncbi:hypothetical protein ANANG_G00169350 [Anguilla anguilla]|uniref:Ribosome assembly protein METTL17, mitochondrial n=1 Tax=Anguilla anguilla TaxID=7936 RepID=A0A9D3M4V5_ANGAN|nr:hypothetical protein ANANG_G00169350 [Anguilla anguilla]
MAALRGRCFYVFCQQPIIQKTNNRWQSVAASLQMQDFLNGAPHRKHPGVTALKSISLPEDLQRAALSVIHGATMSRLADRSHRLTNFLWSRQRQTEDSALRKKAITLEKIFREREKERDRDGDPQFLETQIQKKVLSELKKSTYHWTPLRYDEDVAMVYLAARVAGGYAAVRRALNEIKKRDATFSPHSLLDFGSGVGTVLWAAHTLWGDSLGEAVCVDSSGAMNSLADRLLRGGIDTGDPMIKQVYFRQFLPVSPKVQFDLVVSAFSLSELASQKERRETVRTLWRKTHSYLVLVENGTKDGHQILMEARDTLLTCPHQLTCPKLKQHPLLPCNFPQPYRPLPLHGSADREIERFSYMILTRAGQGAGPGAGPDWARLTGPVLRRSQHVHCQLCCSDGELRRVVVTAHRNGRDMYRCARNSDWGDRLPIIQPEEHTPAE